MKIYNQKQLTLYCDFSGVLLEPFEDEEYYYCFYNLDYQDQDPCFGSGGDEFRFGIKYDVIMYGFLKGTYHFRTVPGSNNLDDYAEAMMMKVALSKCNDKNSPFYQCHTFDAMCRISRILTATRLIETRIINPKDLTK